jgi:hypothetical protein
MTNYQPKRSRGDKFFSQPEHEIYGGQKAFEPIETEITPEPHDAPSPVNTLEGDRLNFTLRNWSGVKYVFECDKCGTHRDTKDEIILHILTHAGASEHDSLLERLTKEK